VREVTSEEFVLVEMIRVVGSLHARVKQLKDVAIKAKEEHDMRTLG
jgi:hypothetical protein